MSEEVESIQASNALQTRHWNAHVCVSMWLALTMTATTRAFKGWLKSSNNMKLISDALVLSLTNEGIHNFSSLSDLDMKSIQCLQKIYKNRISSIEADATNNIASKCPVTGVSILHISISILIVAVNTAKNYGSIDRVRNPQIIAAIWRNPSGLKNLLFLCPGQSHSGYFSFNFVFARIYTILYLFVWNFALKLTFLVN